MTDGTGIEWTHRPGTRGETWNPVVGCSIVSPGCTNCYAMRQAARNERMAAGAGRSTHYAGTTKTMKGIPVWTGKLALAPDHILEAPLRWKSPRTVFVNSMSDLFHEDVPDAWIDRVFAMMALCSAPRSPDGSPPLGRHHTFQILTKRSARMREYVSGFSCDGARRFHVAEAAGRMMEDGDNAHDYVANLPWPLPNVWLGVSAEDQTRADERIPDLLATPAAIRFVSVEPLLGKIDFTRLRIRPDREVDALHRYIAFDRGDGHWQHYPTKGPGLDWIIAGGESGPGARPVHPDWIRQIRDQCRDTRGGEAEGRTGTGRHTAFFFKQWGAWAPEEEASGLHPDACYTEHGSPRFPGRAVSADGRLLAQAEDGSAFMRKAGKKAAGNLLDGVTHTEFPEVRP